MDRGSSYLRGERFHGVNLPGTGERLASRVAASFKEKKGGGENSLQFVSPKVAPSIPARLAFTGFT